MARSVYIQMHYQAGLQIFSLHQIGSYTIAIYAVLIASYTVRTTGYNVHITLIFIYI